MCIFATDSKDYQNRDICCTRKRGFYGRTWWRFILDMATSQLLIQVFSFCLYSCASSCLFRVDGIAEEEREENYLQSNETKECYEPSTSATCLPSWFSSFSANFLFVHWLSIDILNIDWNLIKNKLLNLTKTWLIRLNLKLIVFLSNKFQNIYSSCWDR